MPRVCCTGTYIPALKKFPSMKIWMRFAQCDQIDGKFLESFLPVIQIPIDPANLVILRVRVIVAHLCPAQLIAAANHGDTLGKQQSSEHVALLALTKLDNIRVVGRTLYTTIPGVIRVRAITVTL